MHSAILGTGQLAARKAMVPSEPCLASDLNLKPQFICYNDGILLSKREFKVYNVDNICNIKTFRHHHSEKKAYGGVLVRICRDLKNDAIDFSFRGNLSQFISITLAPMDHERCLPEVESRNEIHTSASASSTFCFNIYD